MGTVASFTYRHLKSIFYKYNIESRAYKFLEKEKLPISPLPKSTLKLKEASLEQNKQIKELHEKNLKLNEFLKKVYVTSTGNEREFKTSRALPAKRDTINEIAFYEPPEPKPDCATLTTILKILFYNQGDPNINVSKLAIEHNLKKESLLNILIYYSLFKKERFDFMNVEEVKNDKIGSKKITFETLSHKLGSKKIPKLKQIEDKK